MDAEMAVRGYLVSRGVENVYYDVPSDIPDQLVVVQRTGGPRGELVIDTPLMDVQCWASSRPAAARLADEVKAAVLDMPYKVDSCFGVNVTSTYRDTDLETGTPRYHVVFEATLVE